MQETLTAEDEGDAEGAPGPSYAGMVLSERYAVGEQLGSGGMGFVYEGRHVALGTRVAVKILRHAGDREATDRFEREARAASAIGHPHIVDVRDMGVLPSGAAYYVMEHLDGRDLGVELSTVGVIPVARAVHIATQVAAALGAAHASGVLHRDLKPENVFLTSRLNARGLLDTDFVKIIDFGIAKLIGGDDGTSTGRRSEPVRGRDTMAGTILGTPMYMAPEQCAGAPTDGRTDLYALGVVLYEMLLGAPPFDGEDPLELMLRQERERPKTLVEAGWTGPPELSAVVMRCLEKSPDARFSNMAELELALAPWLRPAEVSAPSFSRPGAFEPAISRAERSSQVTRASATPLPVEAPASGPASRAGWILGVLAASLVVVGMIGSALYAFSTEAPASVAPVALPASPIAPSVTAPVVGVAAPAPIAEVAPPPPIAASAEPRAEPVVAPRPRHTTSTAEPPLVAEPDPEVTPARADPPTSGVRPTALVADPWGD